MPHVPAAGGATSYNVTTRPGGGAATFDPHTGQVLTLGGTFDVCTNTWTAAPEPDPFGPVAFVFDVDSDHAIAFAPIDRENAVQVWAYEPDGQTWTEMSRFAVGPPPEWFFPSFPQFQAAYDPVTGLEPQTDQPGRRIHDPVPDAAPTEGLPLAVRLPPQSGTVPVLLGRRLKG